jgi:hypothetical protein
VAGAAAAREDGAAASPVASVWPGTNRGRIRLGLDISCR